jgi:hypothetical protein
VTVGIKHIYFWTINASTGALEEKKKGLFGKAGKMTSFTSA